MAEDRMPDAEYRLISKNYIYLKESLHARVLTGHLHQYGVLSHDDLDEIHKQDDLSRRAGVELLLNKLHFVGGCSAFKHFVESLKANGYHRAVELLESTDVDNQTSTSSKQDLQQVVNQQREDIEHHRKQINQLTLEATKNKQMVHTLQSKLDELERSPNNQSCAIQTLGQKIQTLTSGAKEAERERKKLTDEMLALQVKVDTGEAKQEVGASTSGAAGISRPHAGVVGASGINKLQVEAESCVKAEDKVVTLDVWTEISRYPLEYEYEPITVKMKLNNSVRELEEEAKREMKEEWGGTVTSIDRITRGIDYDGVILYDSDRHDDKNQQLSVYGIKDRDIVWCD